MSEEKSNNKTCNNCKLSEPSGKDNWVKCTKKHNDLVLATAPQCKTPYITNGDRIRAMSNEEWATVWSEQAFMFAWCYDCLMYCQDEDCEESRLKCKTRMLNYLNSPANGDCFKEK
jgi:hypothetical protein